MYFGVALKVLAISHIQKLRAAKMQHVVFVCDWFSTS